METRWTHRTSGDFRELREASKNVCLIPMGCVEKHGLHLPLGIDILHSSHIAHMASQLETCCVFPDFTFGDVNSNAPIEPDGPSPDGYVCISIETQMKLLEELCFEISRNGYNKIMIYNGHGGNQPWLQTFMRKIDSMTVDFIVCYVMMDLPVPHKMAQYIEEHGSGSIPELTKEDEDLIIKYHNEKMLIGHGCMSETAYMMGIDPSTVHLDRLGIESGIPLNRSIPYKRAGITLSAGGWHLDVPYAYGGTDPVGCNERIGKAALRIEAERLANAVKLYKEDTLLWEVHQKRQRGRK